jgi:hypothetical protein
MILVIANMGIERITPEMPHIQNQKTSEMMTTKSKSPERSGLQLDVVLGSGASNE